MWTFILSAIGGLIGLFTGKKADEAKKAGATEAANVQLREGIDTIRRADEAAQKVEQEQKNAPYDPDDRADPRNAGRL